MFNIYIFGLFCLSTTTSISGPYETWNFDFFRNSGCLKLRYYSKKWTISFSAQRGILNVQNYTSIKYFRTINVPVQKEVIDRRFFFVPVKFTDYCFLIFQSCLTFTFLAPLTTWSAGLIKYVQISSVRCLSEI